MMFRTATPTRSKIATRLIVAFAAMAMSVAPSAAVPGADTSAVSASLHTLTSGYAATVATSATSLHAFTPADVVFAWIGANAGGLEVLHDARGARKLWGIAESIAAESHWPLREIMATNAGARLSLDFGDFDDAKRSAQRARALAMEVGDEQGEASADFFMSNSLRLLGDVGEAQKFAADAAAIAQRRHDAGMSARALTELATLSKNRGDYLGGLDYEIQALAQEQSGVDIQTQAITLSKLGKLYEQIEDNTQALEYQTRALALAEGHANRDTLAHILGSYANTLNDISPEQNRRALEYAKRALAFALETGNRTLEIDSELQIARAQFNGGELDLAARAFEHVLTLARAIGQKASVAHILLRQSELFERTGHLADALANTRAAIELYLSSDNLPRLIKAYAILERQLDANTDHAGAVSARLQRFELRDRVLGASAMRNLAELEAKKRQDSQNQQIELLKRQAEIDTLRLERGTLTRWLTILLATSLACALLLVIWRFWLSLRVNRLLQGKNQEILQQQQKLETANSELRLSAERLYEVASVDTLTGALSRSRGFEKLANELSIGDALSVLLIDVDHFKLINDRHGHLQGDRVLASIAECLRSNLREGDALVRFGGEEFLVLLPHTDIAQASALAEQLRMQVDQSSRKPAQHLHVTISIGLCAVSQLQNRSIETLLGAADQALYAAKHAGRNRVMVYTAGSGSAGLRVLDS